MKKMNIFKILLAGALVLVLASCENINPNDNSGKDGRSVKLGLKMEPLTKVTLSDGGLFAWENDDIIAVRVGASESSAAFNSFAVDDTRKIEMEIPAGQDIFYAVYPGSLFTYDEGLKVTLPNTYALSAVEDTKTPLPMVALYDGNESLTFYNLGGLLRLTLNNIPTSATSIQLTFDQNVAGIFSIPSSVVPGTSEMAVANHSGDDSKVITITGLTGAATTYDINLPLPTGTYEKVYITYLDNTSQELYTAIKNLSSTAPTTSVPAPAYTARRAYGKKVTVDPSKLAFRGYWVAPGTLKREVDGSNVTYSITDGNPTEFKSYYQGKSASINKYYFNWTTITTDGLNTSDGTNSKFPNGWKMPLQSEFNTIVAGDLSGDRDIYVNGYKINSTLSGSSFSGYFAQISVTDEAMNGVLLLKDGAHIVTTYLTSLDDVKKIGNKNSAGTIEMPLAELNRLISEYGCVFLPPTGMSNGTKDSNFQQETAVFAVYVGYLYCFHCPTVGTSFQIGSSPMSTNPQMEPSTYYYPVRLIKAAN